MTDPMRPAPATVLVERDDGVVRILLNRPAHGNAVNRAMAARLSDVLDQVRADDTVSAVILGGAGDRFFCTGGDVKEYGTLSPEELGDQFARMRAVCSMIEALPVPVVAAIDGPAVGGGLELALACDIRIASGRAWCQLPNVRLGVVTAWDGGRRLAELVGTSRAREMVFSGRRVTAAEALAIGLVTSVAQSARDAAGEFAATVARAPVAAVRRVKEVVRSRCHGHDCPAAGAGGAADAVLDLWFSVGTIRQPAGVPAAEGGEGHARTAE
ncbi:enoyl-CoA hydratase/isomerase family protein [Actinophytocola sp.]|uniref:enoyl-CoA hydratase/isomerase family protein n=1 Tax=Actinophytocola sp. TaxID=1872138 RepID=UPI003D6AF6BA